MSLGRKTKKPMTAARVEGALHTLEEIMSQSSRANMMVPIWKMLTAELDRLREEEAIVAAVRARVRQSSDRTEARPG